MDAPDANPTPQLRVRPLPSAVVERRSLVKTEPIQKKALQNTDDKRKGLIDGELTRKQQLFVEYYLQNKSAVEAARLAGYSEYTAKQSHLTLLANKKVAAEIHRRTEEVFQSIGLTTDKILQETACMAFANILDFIQIQPDGKFKVDLNLVNRYNAAAIVELTYDAEGRPRIRLADKKGALELLARYNKFKMLVPDAIPQGTGNQEQQQPLTIQRLDHIIQNITINQQFNGSSGARPQLPPQTLDAQTL